MTLAGRLRQMAEEVELDEPTSFTGDDVLHQAVKLRDALDRKIAAVDYIRDGR